MKCDIHKHCDLINCSVCNDCKECNKKGENNGKETRNIISYMENEFRKIIFEISEDEGGHILHYNEKIDEILNKAIEMGYQKIGYI